MSELYWFIMAIAAYIYGFSAANVKQDIKLVSFVIGLCLLITLCSLVMLL